MRSSLILVPFAFAACADNNIPGEDPPAEVPAFTIVSSDVTIAPGDEVTKCFYFHTPNTTNLHIHKWVSDMSLGSHHMIYFSNLGAQPADGTVDDCEGITGTPLPVYGSQIAHQEADFPKDDVGVQLAQIITPNTAGYLQMHYVNSTDGPLTAHIELSAFEMEAGQTFTRTDLFGVYNADISIPPHATNFKVTGTCDVVQGVKFWSMQTHSHKQTIAAEVKDSGTTLLTSTDWEHPTTQQWTGPDFYTFTSQITWDCTYDNVGDNANSTIVDGQSARTNEMCVASGYYFPAAGARGCILSGGQCQCVL